MLVIFFSILERWSAEALFIFFGNPFWVYIHFDDVYLKTPPIFKTFPPYLSSISRCKHIYTSMTLKGCHCFGLFAELTLGEGK